MSFILPSMGGRLLDLGPGGHIHSWFSKLDKEAQNLMV